MAAKDGTVGMGGQIVGVPISPKLIKAARFAVEQHNMNAKANLKFVELLEAKEQVVAGFRYYLTLKASEAGSEGKYEAIVWDQVDDIRVLVDFHPLYGSSASA